MVSEYILNLESEKKSPATIRTYSDAINHFLTVVGKEEKDITKLDCVRYMATINNLSSSSISVKLNAINDYFRFLVDMDIIPSNPVKSIERPSVKNKVKEFMDMDDVRSLIASAKTNREKAIITTACSTGVRFSELANITLNDYHKAVESGSRMIIILGKGSKEREIFLNDSAIASIERYLAERTDDGEWLFATSTGNQIDNSNMDKLIKKIAREAGIEFNVSMHCCRAACASIMNENGIDIGTIRDTLGHSSTATTSRYIKTSEKMRRNANALMNF